MCFISATWIPASRYERSGEELMQGSGFRVDHIRTHHQTMFDVGLNSDSRSNIRSRLKFVSVRNYESLYINIAGCEKWPTFCRRHTAMDFPIFIFLSIFLSCLLLMFVTNGSVNNKPVLVAIKVRYRTMMTSSNGNIFRVTGPLCGKFTGPGEFPAQRASYAELWCFLWSASEQTVE